MEFINTDETIEINNLDQMSLKQYQEYIKINYKYCIDKMKLKPNGMR